VYLLQLKTNPVYKARPEVQILPDEDWLPIIVRCRDINLDPTARTTADTTAAR